MATHQGVLIKTVGYAAHSTDAHMTPYHFERRALRTWGVKEGSRVGVIGLGGLGHRAANLAVSMGRK